MSQAISNYPAVSFLCVVGLLAFTAGFAWLTELNDNQHGGE